MTTLLLRFLLVGNLVAASLALGACKQEEGKACQTSSDCTGDLVCCYDGQSASSSLGTCLPVDTCSPILDGGVDGLVRTHDWGPSYNRYGAAAQGNHRDANAFWMLAHRLR